MSQELVRTHRVALGHSVFCLVCHRQSQGHRSRPFGHGRPFVAPLNHFLPLRQEVSEGFGLFALLRGWKTNTAFGHSDPTRRRFLHFFTV